MNTKKITDVRVWPTWLLRLTLIISLLGLGGSGTLFWEVRGIHHNAARLNHTDAAAHCWDTVLDKAVTAVNPSPSFRPGLIIEAKNCAKLIP